MTTLKIGLRYLMALFFIGAGIMHFVKPAYYVRIMPPYLPWHLELVYISGVCEIALGVLLAIPACSRQAAWGLIALLIAVFPANVYAAMNPQVMPEVSPTGLLIRLPFQILFIAWAWWYTR